MAPSVADVADISSLVALINDFNHPLKQFAAHTVAGHFVPNAALLIITDMPSMDDDAAGLIMTGAAGALLDKMLGAIGLSRGDVSIMPLIFWRTPGGRAPTAAELDLARPFVDKAAELLRPRAILTLGTLAAAGIAGAKLPGDHGKILGANMISIFHPNYLLLKPDAKRPVWDALQKLQNLLQNS